MIVNKDVENFIRNISATSNEKLLEIENYADKYKIPIIEAEVRNFLDILIRIKKPMKILEIGTAIGYSAIIMKMACKNSRITTIEIKEQNYLKAKENINKFGFGNDIHCILGDANEVLDYLNDEYDLIFMDAAKGQYINFFEKSIDKLKNDGILISDNILFRGMITNEEIIEKRHRKITIVKRLKDYIEILYNDNRIISCIVPIDDGIAISYKK